MNFQQYKILGIKLVLLLAFADFSNATGTSHRKNGGVSLKKPKNETNIYLRELSACPVRDTSLNDLSTCPKNCTTDVNCSVEIGEKCQCFGKCGLSCIDEDKVSCKHPGNLENGKVVFIGSTTLIELEKLEKVPVKGQILFECDHGYLLTDGPLGKTCEDGNWEPEGVPRCTKTDSPGFHWLRTGRLKRRAIKPGGSVVRNANKPGGGSGGLGSRRGGKKKGSRTGEEDEYEMAPIFCPSLEDFEEKNLQFQVIQHGSDYNETFSNGAVVKVSCTSGFGVNVPNETVRCDKGKWRPKIPQCSALPCRTPYIDHGIFYEGKPLYFQEVKKHKTVVDVRCAKGYVLKGPAKFHCWYGEWDVQESPECVLAPPGSGKNERNLKKSCGPPPRENGAFVYEAGLPVDWDIELKFPDSTEVVYRCSTLKPKTKNKWKITCEDGHWVGMGNLTCDGDAPVDKFMTLPILNMINGVCTYKKPQENVVTFYNDQIITQDNLQLTHGTIITSRCVDIGKYRLDGAVRRKCLSGQWMGITPKCEGLSQVHDYASNKSPTILFRYTNGSIVQSMDGKLVVYPGTNLHMECIWIRKFGKPRWETTNKKKEYKEGWAETEGRDNGLEYRLTIENAQPEDDGTYSCVTPTRHSHQIKVIVKAASCDPLPPHPDLEYSTNDTILGTIVSFKCQQMNSLVGVLEIFCSETGGWSAPLPRCENVECPDISLLPAMAPLAYTSVTKNGALKKNETAPPKIKVESTTVGGRVSFSCQPGYMIEGSSEAYCLGTGEWSTSIPLCKEVECPSPPELENGFATGSPPYRAGNLATFECEQGYRMEGQSIIACQDNGKWSKTNGMKCKISCGYPGTVIGGRLLTQVKFNYEIGEKVEIECATGFVLHGSRILHCLKTGKWSAAIPNCTPLNYDHVSNFQLKRSNVNPNF